MTPFLQLTLLLVIIITAAKLGGYISLRLGQPSVLGELVVGILLGPSLLNIFGFSWFNDSHLPETTHQLAEIGVLMLMFIAGLELHLSELLRSGKVAALAGTLGVLLPLGLGTLTGILFSMEILPAVFLGLILSATSVSISAQTLIELKVLRSRIGVGLLGAAVFDDVLVLLTLSIVVALTQPASAGLLGVLWIVVKMVLFLGLASAFGLWVLPKLTHLMSKLQISQGLVALAFVILLLYGWSAEVIGEMAAITGAFFAGLWFGRLPEKEHIQNSIAAAAYGLFVPVFFINIGLSVNARLLTTGALLLMLVIIIVAVLGKIIGSGAGALLGGYTKREALQLGIGMVSRGEVGLIVATIGVNAGFIRETEYAAVLGMVIATTLLTPPMLRAAFKQRKKPAKEIPQEKDQENTAVKNNPEGANR